MRIYPLLCLLSFFIATNTYAQNTLYKYKIEGQINADTGTIKLAYSVDSNYYPKSFKMQTTKVVNHEFHFEGTLPYPQGVFLSYNNNRYMSGDLIIEPGLQSIVFNIDSNKKVPKVTNRSMDEYYTQYIPFFKEVIKTRDKLDTQWDSLKKVYNNNVPNDAKLPYIHGLKASYAASDKTLLQYVQQHPDSYLAFWRFTTLTQFGYERIFTNIYDAFSHSIKNTYTGKLLGEKLANAGSLTAMGKPFPQLTPVTAANKKFDGDFYKKNTFTLIDFWYSNCGPCIAQFDDLKDLYKDYHAKGFEIIGVSTDKLAAGKNWKTTIGKHQLPWLQYWDKNGAESYKLSIVVFPTNFLVNDKGIIVQKNLSPAELKEFLQANIPPTNK